MRRLFFALLFSFEASSGLFCGREGRRLGNVACVGWAILRVSWMILRESWAILPASVNKYKCVFSVGIYSNSWSLVANHTIFLLFLYALKAEGRALATEC